MSADYLYITCEIKDKKIGKMLLAVFNSIEDDEDDDEGEAQEPEARINSFLSTPMELSNIFEHDNGEWCVEECSYTTKGRFKLDVMGGYFLDEDDNGDGFCERLIRMLDALGAKNIQASYENSQGDGDLMEIRLKNGEFTYEEIEDECEED